MAKYLDLNGLTIFWNKAKEWMKSQGYKTTDTNTTYTFVAGTDGNFKVTPSGGSAQTVSVGKPATAGKADSATTATTAATADKTKAALMLKIKTGATEGTDLYTFNGSTAKTLDIKAGSNVTLTPTEGVLTIAATDTKYNLATQSANGLMSSNDKQKLDNLKEFGGYVTAGQKADTVLGAKATAEGNNTTASGYYSHAEGNITTASGACSHAEGNITTASGFGSHTEGNNTTASGDDSHAEGSETTASGVCSHAEGSETTASGYYQHAGGKYNVEKTGTTGAGSESAFIIGNGTSSARSNAFRVQFDGEAYGKKAYNTTGADYAEYFEWADGNTDKEDRRGLFVTLDGDKIRTATEEDDYILGIVSPNPSVVGNSPDEWHGRYLKDEWGSYIKETITERVKKPTPGKPEGEWETEERQVESYVLNPDFTEDRGEYVPRSERAEWAAVGMLGVLVTRDDGTCRPNGYCKVGSEGKATASETGYRVLKRVSDSLVKVLFR